MYDKLKKDHICIFFVNIKVRLGMFQTPLVFISSCLGLSTGILNVLNIIQ